MALDSFDPRDTKGRHAGDLSTNAGREVPVREFRETPLKNAVEGDLIQVPSHVEEGFRDAPYGETEKEELLRLRAEQARTVEKNKKRKRYAIIGSAATAILATGAVIVGINNNDADETPEPQPSNSAEPFPADPETPVEPEVPVEVEPEVQIPAEAQEFVELYGYQYEDPVATYYAEEGYMLRNDGLKTIISDEFISTYTFPQRSNGELSLLGGNSPEYTLSKMKFAPGTEINNDTFMELFNTGSIPNLNRYMNLLAKNPSPQARDVINNEFKIYVSPSTESATTLMGTLASVVDIYGSQAVYEVVPVSEDGDNESSILPEFSYTTIDSVDEEGNILAFGGLLQQLAIEVTIFDNTSTPTTTTHLIDNVKIVFNYDPITGPKDEVHPGYISVGQL